MTSPTALEKVRRWRDRLRAMDPTSVETGLSPEGTREAWIAALDALDDRALSDAESMGGRPFPHAVIVAAETVFTAPMEWCAVLLGRGSAVVIKHASDAPGCTSLLVQAAREVGLPLGATDDREVVRGADLVVAMGSDETIAELRASLRPDVRFLPHGHRFSVAWVAGREPPSDPFVPGEFLDSFGSVAADAVLHDGRGCLSPASVFTSLPLEEACDRFASAFARASLRWPAGVIGPAEGAAQRARRALARSVGVAREGDGWSIHGLPAAQFSPSLIPRSLCVVSIADVKQATPLLAPYRNALSTVGTDAPETARNWIEAGATRICRVGRMQRPPLIRPHDGEDWIRASAIAVSIET